MTTNPLQRYQQALETQGFVVDPAQRLAIEALQACYEAVEGGRSTHGLYLWGPVGRGKTWLMDQFHRCLTVQSRRQHFHHFMAWVHRRLFELNGTPDPLMALAEGLASEIRVLCFDE
ncbi:MAG TPA: cell division protein ZapE, partial [Pseudomonas sp.]|nr:cell division protein ZapE [Pseudomonas sp.]